ncbi:MAG: recombinase family protein, partial [Bacteroidota bacterium]
MNDLELFRQRFGIGAKTGPDPNDNKRTVLWTRVSTKGQEDNTSLNNQRETCYRIVENEALEVIAEFGGKGESAKAGSVRKEFHRMLAFVKKKSNRVRYIVFYDHSRFSREGGKAIYVKDELRDKYGIITKSAVLPLDIEDPYADAMDSTQYLMARAENEKRKRRCMEGVRARLRQGYWSGPAPTGYMWDRNRNEIVIDPKTGPLVRKVILMRYKDPTLTNAQVAAWLQKRGLTLSKNTVLRLFKNPLYCGLIAQKLLEGDVVEGKHEPLVSREVFMAVNQMMQAKSGEPGKHHKENDRLPLKVFMRCGGCGEPMTGYEVRTKDRKQRRTTFAYYKCRAGCGVNRNAGKVDALFLAHLKQYRVQEDLTPLIAKELRASLIELSAEKFKESERFEKRLQEIDAKLKRLRRRFVLDEEITRAEHDEFAGMLQTEKEAILEELEKSQQNSSNTLDHIEECVQLSANLAHIWEKGGYKTKQRLQNMAFPDGMIY